MVSLSAFVLLVELPFEFSFGFFSSLPHQAREKIIAPTIKTAISLLPNLFILYAPLI